MKKTDIELQRAQMLKALRTAIRLKHGLAADRELNERLPELESQINEAIANGKSLELTVGGIFDEV
jgi:hypothetical protein